MLDLPTDRDAPRGRATTSIRKFRLLTVPSRRMSDNRHNPARRSRRTSTGHSGSRYSASHIRVSSRSRSQKKNPLLAKRGALLQRKRIKRSKRLLKVDMPGRLGRGRQPLEIAGTGRRDHLYDEFILRPGIVAPDKLCAQLV
jgi:hypothetical protein